MDDTSTSWEDRVGGRRRADRRPPVTGRRGASRPSSSSDPAAGKRIDHCSHLPAQSTTFITCGVASEYTMANSGMEDQTITHDLPDPAADNVLYDPSLEELRSLSAAVETTTEFGSPSYVSRVRSRSADRTKNTVDDGFSEADWEHLRAAQQRAREVDLVCVDRLCGDEAGRAFPARLYVPTEYARIALAWAKLFRPTDREPVFRTLQLPEYGETLVRVLPDEGVTYVLGSDYTGEAKKSVLRLFMYETKRRGGLGLHAGSKRVCLRPDGGESGDLRAVGQVFLGLSATGKSTLTGHGFWLDDPEYAEMLQDDVCAMLPDGSVVGSEGGGLYIKTIGLDEAEQPALYHAATQPDAVLENVHVEEDGTVDFDSDAHTSNSRAVVRRADLPSAAADIDLERVDQVFFITRNPLMPPIARLSPEQGAAAFMLGESIETSAGDPERAGEPVRVVGTNPFIIGSPGAEGNRFLDLVRDNGVDCHVINTGSLGDERDVGVEESVAVLTAVARGSIEWYHDETLGLRIPSHVPGIDVEEFYPPDYVSDYDERLADIRSERTAYLEGFDDLRPEIVDAAY